MRPYAYPIALFSLFSVIAATTLASEPPRQLILQWDNDIFAGTDRGYTNGGRIAFLQEYRPDDEIRGRLKGLLRDLSRTSRDGWFGGWTAPPSAVDDLRFAWGAGLTQLMFTPEDPEPETAPEGERPYAGWLGLEFSAHLKDADAVSSVTLSLGTTGEPSFAEDVQTWVHEDLTDSPVFQGWDSQVPAEPTVNLHFDQKRRLGWLESDEGIELDGFVEWGAAVGNFQTNAYGGALLRVGTNLAATFATPRLQLGSYGHAFFEPTQSHSGDLSFYGFAGLRGTAVAHDITLDGPVFRDFDTGTSSEPLVGEVLLGLGIRLDPVSLTLAQTLRTREFDDQRERQSFGSIQLRIGADF